MNVQISASHPTNLSPIFYLDWIFPDKNVADPRIRLDSGQERWKAAGGGCTGEKQLVDDAGLQEKLDAFKLVQLQVDLHTYLSTYLVNESLLLRTL